MGQQDSDDSLDQGKKNGLWLPNKRLALPPTPHEERMHAIGSIAAPSKSDPAYEVVMDSVMESMNSNPAAKKESQRRYRLARALFSCVQLNGTGLIMARTLREQMNAFCTRAWHLGLHALPAQFNIFEAFMTYIPELNTFTLRNEHEQLLRIDDFFSWYEKKDFELETRILYDSLSEGQIYSYSMANTASDFRFPLPNSTAIVAGVSMIRHSDELTCIVVAGENPPSTPDDRVAQSREDALKQYEIKDPDKEGFSDIPMDEISVKDRYLPEFPGYSRIHWLLRFDLRSSTNKCWYLVRDLGLSYELQTNDPVVLEDLDAVDRRKYLSKAHEIASDYEPLLAASTALLYLPVLYAEQHPRVESRKIRTGLHGELGSRNGKLVRRRLGTDTLVDQRSLRCLTVQEDFSECEARVSPPKFEFEMEGSWRALKDGEFGEDRDGNPIAGKTWVATSSSWTRATLDSFLVRRSPVEEGGPKSGYIYLMRSPSHAPDVYKIGLTQVTPRERAISLSKTSSPLPFGVLASWFVDDCFAAEKEIHEALAQYRVDPRREFFRLEASRAFAVANEICTERSLRP